MTGSISAMFAPSRWKTNASLLVRECRALIDARRVGASSSGGASHGITIAADTGAL
jgi:hypothetical protein